MSTVRRQALPRVPEASVSPRPGATSACSILASRSRGLAVCSTNDADGASISISSTAMEASACFTPVKP